MANKKTTDQRIELIALIKIVPAGYQRGTKAEQVNNIIAKFNEAKLDALLVSVQKDGTYHVIDGAHRTEALRKMGYTHAMARVLTGLSYEQEADLFARQNEDVRILTGMDFYKAGVIAKNDICLRIEKILAQNGFQVGKGKDFKNISAVQTLQIILSEYGVICYRYDEAVKNRAFLTNTHNTIRRNFCRVLVEQYNMGLRCNQKAYLKWEAGE